VRSSAQTENWLCGPMGLKMVMQYLGKRSHERKIARLARATQEYGTTGEGLIFAAKQYGFHEAHIRDHSTIDDIRTFIHNRRMPVIVDYWSGDDGHYSVVTGIDDEDDENIHFQDPALGHECSWPINDFLRNWFDFETPYLVNKEDIILQRMIVLQNHITQTRTDIQKTLS